MSSNKVKNPYTQTTKSPHSVEKNKTEGTSINDKEKVEEPAEKGSLTSSAAASSSSSSSSSSKPSPKENLRKIHEEISSEGSKKDRTEKRNAASSSTPSLKRLAKPRSLAPGKGNSDDPHNIVGRFVENHLLMFGSALREIRSGEKRSCWMWFILPTAPHIVNGVEKGSIMNRRFALRGDEAVDAYLCFCRTFLRPSRFYAGYIDPYADPYADDTDEEEKGEVVVNLRQNYIDIVSAVQEQLTRGNTMSRLFGPIDDVKAISSFKLFEKAGARRGDEELRSLCRKVLDLSEEGVGPRNRRKRKGAGTMWKYLTSRNESM